MVPDELFDRYWELQTAVEKFFEVLDYTEESDSGRVFHPTTIGSCRVMETEKMEKALKVMKTHCT